MFRLVLFLLAAPLLAGEPETLVETAAVGNPTFDTTWGTTVERDGDLLVVGRETFDGSASVFREVDGVWTFEQELVASDGQPGDGFGQVVGVSGDVIVVGARNADGAATESGAAYVFRHDGASWVEEAKLVPNDIAAPSAFTDVGVGVAVDGDVVLVGASSEQSVWEFTWSGATWQQTDRFGPSGGFSWFGWRIAIDDGRALVFDLFDQIVFVYRRDVAGWVEESALFTSGFGSDFGRSMDLDGDTAVIGAPEPDGQGSAFVYLRSGTTWSLAQELVPPGTFRDLAGTGVAVEGDTLVVGAPLTNGAASGSGAAFLYRRAGGGWTLEAEIEQGVGLTGDRFGVAVDVHDGEAFVSATSAGLPFTGPGTVYVFDVAPDGPWIDVGQGLAGQAGVPSLTGSGTLEADTPVTLSLANAAALKPAVLVVGFSELGAPFKGGVLVPSPDLVVSGLMTPLAVSSTWPAGVPSGFSAFFQVWIVDAFGPAGFAASNGLQGVSP